MKRIFPIFLVFAIPAAIPSEPAYGCSFSWKKGHSPEDIKRSSNNRKIEGTFKLEMIVGEDADGNKLVYYGAGDWPGTMHNPRVLGTITSEFGRKWKTINSLNPQQIGDGAGGCIDFINGLFPVPEADAEGSFWIETSKRRGRHRIRIWEGQYLPRPEENKTKD